MSEYKTMWTLRGNTYAIEKETGLRVILRPKPLPFTRANRPSLLVVDFENPVHSTVHPAWTPEGNEAQNVVA